jgi:hypothetical protein
MNTTPTDLQLHRDSAGRLVYTDRNGAMHAGVLPVRAFPIAAPTEGISLLGEDGHELAWIARLADLPDSTRTLLEEELAHREFMPEILNIARVSSNATPSIWQVTTDRGDTELTLKLEDDIRRLSPSTLLITDSHGVHFLIRDINKLDDHSRKLLDRFL